MSEVNIHVNDGEQTTMGLNADDESAQVNATLTGNEENVGMTVESRSAAMGVSLAEAEPDVEESIMTAADEANKATQASLEAQQAARNAEEYALRTSAAVNNINNNLGEIEDAVTANRNRLTALEDNAGNHVSSGEVIDGVAYFYNDNGDEIFTITGIGGGGGGGGGDTETTSVVTLNNTTGWASTTVPEGGDAILSFTWSSIEDEVETGDGSLTVMVNSVIRETRNVQQGAFSVNVKDYLSVGNNRVVVTVTDSYGKSKLKNFTIAMVQLYITSSFDQSEIQSGVVNFPYIPYGEVSKTVHFQIDSRTPETVNVTGSGRQMNYVIGQQSHGSHTLRVWFTATVNGVQVTSNVLYYDIMWIVSGNNTPVISSGFDGSSIDQYSTVTVPFMVYNPTSQVSNVSIQYDGLTIATLPNVGREMNSFTLRLDEAGSHSITIISGTARKVIGVTVNEAEIDVEAETENLALWLTSAGRSNLEENPAQWVYDGQGGTVTSEMTGFNFVSNGWVRDEDGITTLRVNGGARATVHYQPFATDFRGTGKTIEIEFAARDIRDYSAVLIDCMDAGRGIRLTAQNCAVAGEQSSLGMEYKDEEHIRVAFVYGKRSGTRLLLCYINGIVSAAMQYPNDDDFSQVTPKDIVIGNDGCTVDVYNIRVYDNDLTAEQIEGNWIADTQDGSKMLNRFSRNNVRDAYGNVIANKLPGDLPYMTLVGESLPTYKGDKKKVSGSFVNPLNPEKSFSFEDADIDVQGTSSQYYEVKNFKMKFKTGFINRNGVVVGTYQIRDDSIPVSTFCMKADVASSEGANNTVLARLYNEACPYKTPAQEEDARVRQGIDGFPMVMFWNNTSTNNTGFVGKYNFNNDKSTEETFGFADGDESWEFKNNTSDRSLFIDADFTSMGVDEDGKPIKDWLNDFEARYPDTDPAYTDKTQLECFCKWVVSTNQAAATGDPLPAPVTYGDETYTNDTAAYRLAKFKYQLPYFAEVESFTFYYLFTYANLLMDNRAKNMFLTFVGRPLTQEEITAVPEADGIRKRATLPAYDFDSALGINNEGKLVFPFWLEDIDQWDDADVYNGQKSVLWINFRQAFWDDVRTMWRNLRASGALSAEKTIRMFKEHQGKWPEAVFNEDAYYKYLRPVETGNLSYLGMLLGSKETQRDNFLTKRYRYIDSQMVSGDASRETVVVRAYAKANITLTPAMPTYLHIRYASYDVSTRATEMRPYTLLNPASTLNDSEVIIYLAGAVSDFGDLSGLKIGYGDFNWAVKATRLQIGSSDANYDNPNLKELSVGTLKLLQYLDVRNCSGLGLGDQKNVDLTGCSDLREVYFTGTNLTGVSLPNGGFLEKLHLPGTITNLTIRNQSNLTEFVCDDLSHVTTLWLENPPASINTLAVVQAMQTGGRARLYNFHWEMEDLDDVMEMFNKLNTMRGIDQNGNNTDKAQVFGSIHVEYADGAALGRIQAMYPDVTITYDHVLAHTYSYNYDGTVLLHTEERQDGVAPVWNDVPEREEDAQYVYTPAGWSLSKNAETADPEATAAANVDITRYAAYSRTLKSYTITFVRAQEDGGGELQSKQVPYGTVPEYTGSTPTSDKSDGGVYVFDHWVPALAAVTGAATYTAAFRDASHTVTFMNGTTLIDTVKVLDGNTAQAPSTTPTKDSTAQYQYTFIGWNADPDATAADSNALTNVLADRTVYAIFRHDVRTYTISFVRASADGGGTLQTETLPYGSMPEYTGDTPTTTKTDSEYQFNGWDPAIASVTGNASYTAVFRDMATPLIKYLSGTMTDYESGPNATKVAEYAFSYMSSLKTVKTAATTIEERAFVNSSNLELLDLTRTSGAVTLNATGLPSTGKFASIIIRSSTMATLSGSLPSQFSIGKAGIYVPSALVATYKATSPWSTYASHIFSIDEYPITNWDTIKDSDEVFFQKLANGTAVEEYNIGDTKTISLGSEGDIELVITAKNADELADGSGNNAGLTITCKTALKTAHRMNPSGSNAEGTGAIGGWGKCEMRTYLNETIWPLLPAALRASIKTVKKYSDIYNTSATLVHDDVTEDKIWLLSAREVFGSRTTYEQNGPIYSVLFTNTDTRIRSDPDGKNVEWWLRSASMATYFRYVQTSGVDSGYYAYNNRAVVFGFCV